MVVRIRWSTLKIGKKLCFPDVPSTWVPRTVEHILRRQDCYFRAPNLKDINGIVPPPPKNNDFEADERRSCNPFCLFPPTPTPFTLSNRHHFGPIGQEHNYVTTYNTGTKDAFIWSLNNVSNAYKLFMNDHIEENEDFFLHEGDTFDVISLLKTYSDYLVRNNGDKVQVDSLRGNNILVLCVFVPCFWKFIDSNTFRGLFTFYEQQNHKAKANSDLLQTEMVIVAKMRRNWDKGTAADEDAFNHFFSGFPSSWLAVPFSHTLRRDHICNSLGLSQVPKCLLVDPNQKVVLHDITYGLNGIDMVYCNPSEIYIWWKKYTQLDLILDLDSHYVFKTTNNNKEVSISQLKQKVVALYLCFDGSFIRTLDMMSQECKARNQEFEVVLVYLPYKDGVNPPLFQEAINHVLHSLNISNWWVSPFDDFVSRRLWEAVEFRDEDKLVILDPHTNNADPFAKSVLHWFGINSYPFTRESLVLRELEALKEVTLESLLVYGSHNHVLRIDNVSNNVEEVPIAQLRGKTVILYVDRVEAPWSEIYPKLLDWYNRIKTTRFANDFEVAFVSCTPFDKSKLLSMPMPMPMPWLVCPFDLEHTDFVSRKTLNSDRYGYLVVFGKDGHIIKLCARHHLDRFGPDGFPPCNNDLCNDVIAHFGHHHDIDMTGVFDPLSDWL